MGSSTAYAAETVWSPAWLALGKCSVPWVNAPGITITVSMPNCEASYDVTWARASNANFEATQGPRNGGTLTVVGLPTYSSMPERRTQVGQHGPVDPLDADALTSRRWVTSSAVNASV